MGFYSEMLTELDRNTVQYMIEEQQGVIGEQKAQIEEQRGQIEEQQAQIEKQLGTISEMKNAQERDKEELHRKDAEIAELKRMIAARTVKE